MADYQIVSGDKGGVINCDTTLGPVIIALPAPAVGFNITVKDYLGNASVYPITIERSAETVQIDGEVNDDLINQNYGAISYISDGTNWFRVSSFTGTPAPQAFVSGGYTGAYTNVIQSFNISTLGNATSFGTLTAARGFNASAASTTRGLTAGGYTGGANSSAIDYITMATAGNGISFGSLTVARYAISGASNALRAVFAGGDTSQNLMDYVTIATTGNAATYGNLQANRDYLGACASPTRGIFAGAPSPGGSGTIEYITFATTGNSTSFGLQSTARYGASHTISSATRGIIAGGYITAVNASNVIDYVTMATTGNAISFGTLGTARQEPAGGSSPTRGVISGGGANGPTYYNTIEYITISTTGNAASFGTLTNSPQGPAGFSNAHGGL